MDNNCTEEYKDISDYEDSYMISNFGNIISKLSMKQLTPFEKNNNLYVTLKHTTFKINKLVYETFVKKINTDEEINNIDANINNNHVGNLEVVRTIKKKDNLIYHKCDIKTKNIVETYVGTHNLKKQFDKSNIKKIQKCVNGTTNSALGYYWICENKPDNNCNNSDEYIKIGIVNGYDLSKFGINKENQIINLETKKIMKIKKGTGKQRYYLQINDDGVNKQKSFYLDDIINRYNLQTETIIYETENIKNVESIKNIENKNIEITYSDNIDEWKFIPGYENRYRVSINGDVYSCYLQKILKNHIKQDGYHYTKLIDENKNRHMKRIHRLVAETYIGKILNDMVVDHIDRNKNNNKLVNLRIITHSENNKNRNIKDNQQNIDINIKNISLIINNTDDFIKIGNLEIYKKDKTEIRNYDRYGINKKGDIININSKHLLCKQINNGYYVVPLTINRKAMLYPIHKLLMHVFKKSEQPPGSYIIDHIDGNKLNNVLSNLRWSTIKENSTYSCGKSVQAINIITNETIMFSSIMSAYVFLGNKKAGVEIQRACNNGNNNGYKGYVWSWK